MRLLCDEMLKALARWLRVAGYDVGMEPDGTADRQLIARALSEGRQLLTRDRSLLGIRHAKRVVVLLESDGLENQARETTHKLKIDWLMAPFTRCSRCNAPLVEAVPPADIPPDVERALHCPCCGKYYWHGSHVRRMRARLKHWQTAFAE